MIARHHLHHPGTHRLALIGGTAAFLVVVYWASFASMWGLWQTTDHRHGLLVFPISAFLVWRLRHRLPGVTTHVDPRGLVLLVPLAMFWVVARLAGVQVIEHLAVLAMIPASVFTLMGNDITRKLLFPLGFILLAVPIGDTMVPYLMVITADISTALLEVSGIPVLRNGQYLSLPGGNFIVADVCSGARYLVTGVMVSLLFGYLTFTSVTKRTVLVVATAVALVIANGLRAYIVMAVASGTNMQYLGGRDHIYFGWLMFGLAMMLILWAGARFADDDHVDGDTGTATLAATASHAALPMIVALGLIMLAITVKPLQADFSETGAMLIAALALLVFVFLVARRHGDGGADVNAARAGAAGRALDHPWGSVVTAVAALAILILPPRFVASAEAGAVQSVQDGGFLSPVPCAPSGQWNNRWRPDFQAPDAELALAFDCGGYPVNIFTAAYASALQGRELISSSHHPVPPQWDRYSSTSRRTVDMDSAGERSVVEVVVDHPAYRAIVWHWYDVDGRTATSSLHTKVLQVLALAQKRPAGGRIVVIETPIGDDPAAARERLQQVAGSLFAVPEAMARGDAP